MQIQEHLTLGVCLLGSAACVGVQGGAAAAVLQASIDASRQQQRRHKHRLPAAGHMQRCETTGALRVHICTSLHQDRVMSQISLNRYDLTCCTQACGLKPCMFNTTQAFSAKGSLQ